MDNETSTADNPKTPLQNSGRDARGRFTNGNPTRFQPGISGNPAGRPASANLSDAYRRQLKRTIGRGAKSRSYADEIARQMVAAAVGGDVAAAREIADRTEGRPRQSVEFTERATDLAAHLRIHGLTVEDAQREAEEVLDELHNLRLDTHEIN
jgi:hypothetical protein